MSSNGDQPRVNLEPTPARSVPSSGETDGVSPNRGSVNEQAAFLEKLRELDYLGHLYASRVAPAQKEWERLREAGRQWVAAENERLAARRKAVEEDLRALRARRDALQAAREEAEQVYAQAYAESRPKLTVASLPVPDGTAPEQSAPPGGRQRLLAWIGSQIGPFFGLLAAVVCGLVLGLCFGTLFGILSLTDLQRGDRLSFAAFTGIVGMTIVLLLGKLMECTVRMYAGQTRPDGKGPWAPIAAAAVGLLLFMSAEIALEGFGLREVHRDYLESFRRLEGGEGALPLLPTPVYFLLGVLVSGPFLGYKLGTAWLQSRHEYQERDRAERDPEPLPDELATRTTQRLVASGVLCRQLRERCEEADGRITTLKEELQTLIPVDAPSTAILDQMRAAEALFKAERDRYEQIIERHIHDRPPTAEARPVPPRT